MKIGITTFQRAHNFGAQMQMFALYEFLRHMGHDVWILDYHCPAVEDNYVRRNPFMPLSKFFDVRVYPAISALIGAIKVMMHNYQPLKIKRFEDFLFSYFKLTKRFSDDKDMPIDFDVLITGSDQLWNYFITKGRRPVYFLDCPQIDLTKTTCISYAVSVESNHFKDLEEDGEYVKNALSKLSWISVREKSLSDFLLNHFNIKAETVLDPTLFLTKEQCKGIAVKPSETHYLCVYRVSRTDYLGELAKEIAKELGLAIVNIHSSTMASSKEESYGPREIIGYICYSDMVLTSSFHGTALSIVNRKDFYSAYNGTSSRVQNILSLLNLENRMLSSKEDYSGFSSVQYDDKLIDDVINQSKSLLVNALTK